MDEESRTALDPPRRGRRLQCPHRRGADRHDAAAVAPDGVAGLERLWGDAVPLAVHPVVCRIGLGDRLERVESDTQLDPGHAHAPLGQRVEEGRREVEARGGCRGRPRPVRVDRLIARRVGEWFGDVGREGRLAGRLDEAEGIAVADESGREGVG